MDTLDENDDEDDIYTFKPFLCLCAVIPVYER